MILPVLRAVDKIANDVGWEKVGRELDTTEAGLHGGSERADGEGFSQPRHAFEQHVAVGEQSDKETVNQLFLTDNDSGDLRAKFFDPGRNLGCRFVERLIHARRL